MNEETTNIGSTVTPLRSNRDTAANTATCEPCDVATTLTRVVGGQSVVDKAQKHSIFSKLIGTDNSFPRVWQQ